MIPSLPHPTPEHTEGLNGSILTKVLCLLKLWKSNSFLEGSLIFFFSIRTTKPRTRICFLLECCFSMSGGPVGLLCKPLWKGRQAHVARASPSRLWTSALADSSDHLTLCLCCLWMDMWAWMVVRVATKYLCFRALDGESCGFRVVGFLPPAPLPTHTLKSGFWKWPFGFVISAWKIPKLNTDYSEYSGYIDMCIVYGDATSSQAKC